MMMDLNSFELSREILESLSEEELRRLAVKLQEHERAAQYKKGDLYLENAHEGQLSFHKAANRVRLFFGGNRSGKSTAGVNEARWLAEGSHPFRKFRTPTKGCIVLQDFQTHANDIILPKIEEWFPPNLIVDRLKNQAKVDVKLICRNKSVIDIKSHDQDLKVFEGSDYDWIWFDEPPPQLIFKALWRGLTDRRGIAFFTGTPITEPWLFDLHQKAQEKGNKGTYWSQFIDTELNAYNLGEGDREEGVRRINEFIDALDPEERDARKSGKFLHMSGVIFKDFKRETHKCKPFKWPCEWPIMVSVDPHPRKPWAYSFLGITPSGNKILLRSGKADGVVEDVAKEILFERNQIELTAGTTPNIVSCWIDNYANVESMIVAGDDGRGIKIVDELNYHIQPSMPGFRAAPKNVDDKIQIFKDWLKVKDSKYGQRPTFLYFDIPENAEFEFEMEHYVWSKMRGVRRNQYKNTPLKENDDILDTIMQLCLVLGAKKGDDSRRELPKVHSYIKKRVANGR